jgi:branched-subunit amino acid transport protein
VNADALVPWLAILGVVATTLVTRSSFILLGDRAKLPPVVERALRYAPACALAAIIGPDLLVQGGAPNLGPGNFRLLAAAAAALAFAFTRSMIWTIVAGMAAFTILRLWA